MHTLIELPQGKRVQDVLPQFAGGRQEIGPLGTPCSFCAGCAKPFRGPRKPKSKIRLYPSRALAPVAVEYRLCGRCTDAYRAGGRAREDVLAGVERVFNGQR